MDVNVASMFLMCRAVVPVMRGQGGGKIVNISSGTPFRGVPFLLHYVTSKGAIVAFTRALAKELGKDNVLVNCVAPGFTMSAGVEAHPEVVEKLRDVSVVGAHDPARPGAGGRRRRGRVPLRPRLRLHHRPDDRDRRRPDLPLILRLTDHPDGVETGPGDHVVYDVAARRGARRRRARRRARARLGADRAARGRVAPALRPRRLPARRCRVPAHASRARGCACCSTGASGSRPRARRTSTARSSGGTRPAPTRSSRPRPRPRRRRSCACSCCRPEWAGKRTIRYVDPADEEKPKLQRARIYLEQPAVSARAAASCSPTSSRCTAPSSRSACPARATSSCSTGCTSRRSG